MTFLDLSSFEKTDEERQIERRLQECRSQGIQFSAGRMKTSGAIREKLLSKNFTNNEIECIMPGLLSDGYIHDREIARAILRERRGRKAESRQAIAHRMMRFLLPDDIIAETLHECESDSTLANEFLDAHGHNILTEYLAEDDYNIKQKLTAKLIRKAATRGFQAYLVLQWLDRNIQ